MYQEIENILVRTLSPYEYEQLEELKKTYSEESIVKAYKNSSVKNINYIKKVLNNKIKTKPEWLDKKIENESLDKESQQEFDEFNDFLEEFRK